MSNSRVSNIWVNRIPLSNPHFSYLNKRLDRIVSARYSTNINQQTHPLFRLLSSSNIAITEITVFTWCILAIVLLVWHSLKCLQRRDRWHYKRYFCHVVPSSNHHSRFMPVCSCFLSKRSLLLNKRHWKDTRFRFLEEWETRKKKEITTTRQIETRVKRQVVLEDGEVVVDSGPLVTTNTTEDVEQQEHTTQEVCTRLLCEYK